MQIDQSNQLVFGVFTLSHHPVAAREPGQPHAAHVEQSHLSVVVRQSDDPLVGRDADPETAE